MGKRIFNCKMWVDIIFFGNYFYALCVVSLSIESALQQNIGLNNLFFYLFLSSATILYYTYAYMGKISFSAVFKKTPFNLVPTINNYYNERTQWYKLNKRMLNTTQSFFVLLVIVSSLALDIFKFKKIFSLQLSEWVILFSVPIVSVLYYGNAFFPIIKLNLRNTGWLKPFVIGFVWSITVTLYPAMFHQWEHNLHYHFDYITFWLLIKNFMYISVLAIMFDIKDYEDDANRGLKTFVVRFGLTKTVSFILLPLTIIGLVSFSYFAYVTDMGLSRYLFNLIPFILLLIVAYSMYKPKPIFYYLAIIDGLMLVKGLCGIVGVLFLN